MIFGICIIVMFINYPILTSMSYFIGGIVTYFTIRNGGIYTKIRLLQEVEMNDRVSVTWHLEMLLFFIVKWVVIDMDKMVEQINIDFDKLAERLGSNTDQED